MWVRQVGQHSHTKILVAGSATLCHTIFLRKLYPLRKSLYRLFWTSQMVKGRPCGRLFNTLLYILFIWMVYSMNFFHILLECALGFLRNYSPVQQNRPNLNLWIHVESRAKILLRMHILSIFQLYYITNTRLATLYTQNISFVNNTRSFIESAALAPFDSTHCIYALHTYIYCTLSTNRLPVCQWLVCAYVVVMV